MANFTFNCPECDQSLEAQDEWRGQQTQCPSCGTNIEIPKIMLVKPANIDPDKRLKKLKNAVIFFIVCLIVCLLGLFDAFYKIATGSAVQRALSQAFMIPIFVIVIFLCGFMIIAGRKKIRELKSQIDPNKHLK